MPLPTPNEGEKTDDFVSRCMGDAVAKRDFPDEKQRLAVCYRQAKARDEKAAGKRMDIEATVTFDIEGGPGNG